MLSPPAPPPPVLSGSAGTAETATRAGELNQYMRLFKYPHISRAGTSILPFSSEKNLMMKSRLLAVYHNVKITVYKNLRFAIGKRRQRPDQRQMICRVKRVRKPIHGKAVHISAALPADKRISERTVCFLNRDIKPGILHDLWLKSRCKRKMVTDCIKRIRIHADSCCGIGSKPNGFRLFAAYAQKLRQHDFSADRFGFCRKRRYRTQHE